MKARLLSGVAGLAVIIITATWPKFLHTSELDLASSLGAFLAFIGIMLGVYLLFYSMTGEWLPKLRNRDKRP